MKSLSEHIQNEIPEQSISARGLVTGINEGGNWAGRHADRWVDVVITSSNSPVPRFYNRVAWNSTPGDFIFCSILFKPPNIGDYVMLGFSGGNPNFPFVSSVLPGPSAEDKLSNSQRPHVKAPTTAIQASHGQLGTSFSIGGNLIETLLPPSPLNLVDSLTNGLVHNAIQKLTSIF